MGGRDQSERLVAINRNSWSRSPGARILDKINEKRGFPLCESLARDMEIEERGRQTIKWAT
jgi:hypothetical protein